MPILYLKKRKNILTVNGSSCVHVRLGYIFFYLKRRRLDLIAMPFEPILSRWIQIRSNEVSCFHHTGIIKTH